MEGSRRFTSWSHVIEYATNQINALGKWEEVNGKKAVAARKRRGSVGRFLNPIEAWQMAVVRGADEQGLPFKWYQDGDGFYNFTFKLIKKLTFKQAAWWHVAYTFEQQMQQISPMFHNSSPWHGSGGTRQWHGRIVPTESLRSKAGWKRWDWERRIEERARKRMTEEHLPVRPHGKDDYNLAVRCAKEKLCFFEFDFGHVLLDTTWMRVYPNKYMKLNHLRGGHVHVLLNSVPVAKYLPNYFEGGFGGFRGDWQRRCIIDSFNKAGIPLPENFKYQYRAQRNIQAALREVSK